MARVALTRSPAVSQLGRSPMSSVLSKEQFLRTRLQHQDGGEGDENEDPDRKGPDYDVITINVGGVFFQTYRKTLKSNKTCRLGNRKFMAKHFNEKMDCYFFDRDPDMFKATLNYLRTGDLHLPSYICGPAAKRELEFWGIMPNDIEQCCWINYNEWNSTQEALKRLEKDRKTDDDEVDPAENDAQASCWSRCRPKVWRFLNNNNAGICAKFFSFLSLAVVVVSIFSFLAETTEPFEYYEASKTSDSDTITTAATVNVTQSTLAATTEETEKRVKVKHPVLHVIDICCVSYFILEFLLRLIFSPKKCKFLISLLSVIDVLAILPDVIETSIYYFKPELRENVDAVSYITLLRVIRVLRIFRLVRHSAGLWILIYTMRASFSELMLLVWFMGLGILVFSSLIYYVEDRELFPSIPFGFWWALITMTTVGYGDIAPANTLGKMVGSLCAMAGVLMIGFTVPALVNNFMLYYRHIQFAMQVEKMEKEMAKLALEMESKAALNADDDDDDEDDIDNENESDPDDDGRRANGTIQEEDDDGGDKERIANTLGAISSTNRLDLMYTRMNGRLDAVELDVKNETAQKNGGTGGTGDAFELKMDTKM